MLPLTGQWQSIQQLKCNDKFSTRIGVQPVAIEEIMHISSSATF